MERLHRSRKSKVIFGVCGGLAEYFRIDPTIIRIICILTLFTGFGIPAYIIAALIIPDEGAAGRRNGWQGSSDPAHDKWKSEWEGSRTGSGDSGFGGQAGSSNGGFGGQTGNGGFGSQTGSNDSFVNDMKDESDNWGQPVKYNSERNRLVLGAILVGLGVLILGRQIIPALFRMDFLVPLLFIGIGGFIVFRGRH